MNKFTKISEKVSISAAGSVLARLVPMVLNGSTSVSNFFGSASNQEILNLITGSSTLQDAFLNSRFGSIWGPGTKFVANIGKNVGAFVNDFMELLEDENFQALAFAAYLEQNNLAFDPSEMYKSKAFQQLYTTKGYKGELISEGAYQRFTGRLPGIDVLPDSSTVNFENDLQTLANQLDGVRDDIKVQKLRQLLNTWSLEVSDFDRFARENYPVLDSYR